jgi:tetratricopeptide (TPR) repeat protein/tRNA A-37 threonylcarbamoyl transferase component Bud32
MIGRTFSHYKVLEKIGEGGMGEVYLAEDTKLKRQVALKFLPEDLTREEERKQRFLQEARMAASIEHPHIAAIHDIDEIDGRTFMAMEHVKGESVRGAIRKKKLGPRKAIELGIQVADGLAVAHQNGVVHRDLKPENILISEQGYAKIIDFGLAKLIEPLLPGAAEPDQVKTRDGLVLGTVSYMSPEQARGKAIDGRSDIFSFALVFYEMLAGENPFKKESGVETLNSILKDPTPSLKIEAVDKPAGIDRVLRKALAKDPDSRYQDIKDMSLDLRQVREGMGTYTGTMTTFVADARSPVSWIAIAVMVLMGVGLGWFLFREPPAPGLSESGRPAVAVLYFESHGGEDDEEIRWLSRGLPNMLLTDLAQTPGLDVVSSQRIHEILKDVGQENVDAIDKSLVADIAQRAGAGAVVVGSIFKLGEEIRIDVQIEDVGSGRVLAAESVRGKDVFPLVDQLSDRIRTSLELGDEPADRPIADVTTGSIEAMELYTEGSVARNNVRLVDARRLLEEAVTIDPSFAMAYFDLSEATRRLGQTGLSSSYLEKALAHVDRLTDRKIYLVQAIYAWRIEGEPDKAIQLLETLVSLYPDEEEAYDPLADLYRDTGQFEKGLDAAERGVMALPNAGPLRNNYGYQLIWAGRYMDAIREFQKYAELSPNEPNPHDSLAEGYLLAGQPERAVEEYARTLELDPSFYASHQGRAWAFGMLGRFDDAFAEGAKVRSIMARENAPPTEILFLNTLTLSRVGRYRDAEETLQESLVLTRSQDDVANQGNLELLSAALALERENYTEARESTKRAQRIIAQYTGEARGHLTLVAHLLDGAAEARSGNIEAAQVHLDAQEKLYNSESAWENWFYHALAGEIALAQDDAAAAETAFSAGEPEGKIWFSMGEFIRSAINSSLPFRDGPARARKAQGDLAGAIQLYSQLNQSGLDSRWTSLMEPRYVLEMARLLDETGDKDGARAEYERFLELWKDADPDLPELKEARAYVGT